ncbi:hypothetical protein [Ferroglobus placidus]|nr:hypothetical protein [Ferroglobus placidus]
MSVSAGMSESVSVVERMMDKLQLLNDLWKRVKVLPEITELANKVVIAEFGVEEHSSPFSYAGYNIRAILDDVRKELFRFVADLLVEDTNVRVDFADLYDRFKDFDAVEVARYIEEKYLRQADELAYREIVSRARALLPAHNVSLEKILKGRKLVLQYYLHWSYGKPYIHDFLEAASALEKLAKIVLWRVKPSTARGHAIYNAYWNDTTDEEVLQKKELGGPIEAVKVHKNGNIYFWFKSEEDAKKVAEVLLSE